MDRILVNVNDQIVNLELFLFFSPAFGHIVNVILCLSLVMAQPIICVLPQLSNDLLFQTRLFQL